MVTPAAGTTVALVVAVAISVRCPCWRLCRFMGTGEETEIELTVAVDRGSQARVDQDDADRKLADLSSPSRASIASSGAPQDCPPARQRSTELDKIPSVARSLGDLWSWNRKTEQFVVSSSLLLVFFISKYF